MVEKAFTSIENYFECFKEIDEIYEFKRQAFAGIVAELDTRYGYLLEEVNSEEEFIAPEAPKIKTEAKGKRESSRAPRKNQSTMNKTTNLNQTEEDGYRKSSRIASKAKNLPALPAVSPIVDTIKPERVEILENIKSEPDSATVSPIQPSNKIRKKEEALESKEIENLSVKVEDQFVMPEIPKIKTTKEKRASSRASRRNQALLNASLTISTVNSNNVEDEDGVRKSSRLASKAKAEQSIVSQGSTILASNEPSNLSKDDIAKFWNFHHANPFDDTVCTEDIQNPISNSTPVTSPKEQKFEEAKLSTPVIESETTLKPNSVKKRIEEFEKKTKTNLAPSKLPVKTPEKKKPVTTAGSIPKVKKTITGNVSKTRMAKNANILRERNVNAKAPIAEKTIPMTKSNTDESTRKKTRQATAQRGPTGKVMIEKEKEILKNPKEKSHKDVMEYDIERALENESSEDEERPKKQVPNWATKELREHPLNVQSWLDKQETIYPWFYSKKLKTPKLEDLFSCNVRMRPRTSSAVWNTRTHFT